MNCGISHKKYRLYVLIALAGVVISSAAGAQRLSPDQKERFKALAATTERKLRVERENLKVARTDMVRISMEYRFDTKKAQIARSRIEESQRSLLEIHLDNQVEMRRILNSTQFADFKRIMGKKFGAHDGMIPPNQEMMLDKIPDRQMLEAARLSEEQKRKLGPKIGFTPERKKLMDSIQNDTRKMLDLYAEYNLDVNAARKLIDSIHRSQVAMGKLNEDRQEALRDVLTESQFDRLKNVMMERIKQIEPKRPRRR